MIELWIFFFIILYLVHNLFPKTGLTKMQDNMFNLVIWIALISLLLFDFLSTRL